VRADVDPQRAGLHEPSAADQQPQQVHDVLPAWCALPLAARLRLGELGLRVAGEGAVGAAGEERRGQPAQFGAERRAALHQRAVQHLQEVGVGRQRKLAEPLDLPAELLGQRPVDVGGRLAQPPEVRGGRHVHPAAVGV
jgi:hypothetical protein